MSVYYGNHPYGISNDDFERLLKSNPFYRSESWFRNFFDNTLTIQQIRLIVIDWIIEQNTNGYSITSLLSKFSTLDIEKDDIVLRLAVNNHRELKQQMQRIELFSKSESLK